MSPFGTGQSEGESDVCDESGTVAELHEENERLRQRICELEQAQRCAMDGTPTESEQVLKTIVESAADGILVADVASKQFLVANRTICQMLGYSQEELRTLRVTDIHLEQDIPYVMEQLRKQTRGEVSLVEGIRVRRKDQSVFRADIHASPITLAGKTYLMGIFRDVDEHVAIRDRNETILKTCEDGFWLVDKDGRILEVNDAYCRMSGYSRDELLTMSIQDLEAQETAQEVAEHTREIISKGTHRFESRHRCKDGTIIDLDVSTHRLRSDSGRIFTFFRDITAQKQAEQALRESEARYRTLVEQLPAVTYTAALDQASTTLYVSPQIEKFIGFSPEEYRADPDTWRERLHPEDRNRVLQAVAEAHAEKKGFTQEYRMIGKDGRVQWFRDEAVVVKDQNGRPLFLQGVMHDINRQKKTEEDIRRFKTIADNANYGIGTIDLGGSLIYVNDTFAQMHGYRPEELIGEHVSIFHTAEQMEQVNQLNRRLVEQGSYIAEEVWHKKRDNTVFPALMTATAIKDEKGKILFLAATAIDITEHKKAQEAARKQQTLIEGILDHASSVIVVRDTEGRYIMVNQEAENVLGMSHCDIVGKTPYDIHSSDKARKLLSDDKQVIESGKPFHIEDQLEVRGEVRTFLGARFPLLNPNNEPYAVCTVAADITERTRAEAALRESEQRYRTLVESAGETIATVDINGVFMFLNVTGAKRLGGVPGDFIGKTMWDLFPGETADRQAASVRKVITTGQGMNVVVPTHLHGELRWYNTTIEPLRDSSGETTAAMIVARDIHELMAAQEKIRTLTSAVEQSIDGVARSDLEARLLYVNEAYARMHGYSREEMSGMNAATLYSKDQTNNYEEVLRRLTADGSFAGEVRRVRKDGTLFPCYISITLVRDERGETVGTVVVCRDMTEARRNEEELGRYRGQMARAEKLASLGTLSATVAHQITQPLTVIRLSLENTLDELEGMSCWEKALRRLQDSVVQVSNITDIINRFRNFARQSSDTRFGQVGVLVVAARVVRLLEETARQARVSLHLKDMDRLPAVAMNETDLEQLFFALLENAIQAADGTRSRKAIISGSVTDGFVELLFSDNCGGIPPEIQEKVFEPFFTTKPRGQGTGLGLCIVHEVVTRIGGRVRVESELGKGTTFFVALPVYQGKVL